MVWSKGLMISNLESVWKAKKDSDITLRQLEEHRSDLCDGGKNHGGTGVGWPELGFKVLLDIMDNKLNHVHVYICVFK